MSNSNHDPKNKECHGNHEEYCGEKCDHCTCPEQNMEEKKCMCGEHQLGYFIISERIGETIHSRESPCWVIEKEDHTKCRKLGASDLCVCCPCGCDTPMDAPNYAELHGAPTEQKEEWESMKKVFLERYVNPDDRHNADASLDGMKFFYEQRGRSEEVRLFMESIQKNAETVPPNLLLNEVVNYAYDRIKTLTQKS